MSLSESQTLLQKMEALHTTLNQVYGLVNPIRPLASDVWFQCMHSGDLAAKDVAPGRTFLQVGEEFVDSIESIASLMATASGNLALLMGALHDENK